MMLLSDGGVRYCFREPKILAESECIFDNLFTNPRRFDMTLAIFLASLAVCLQQVRMK
jgi:hypothetical protein